MSVIKMLHSTTEQSWTINQDTLKQLIARDIGVRAEEITVDFEIESDDSDLNHYVHNIIIKHKQDVKP